MTMTKMTPAMIPNRFGQQTNIKSKLTNRTCVCILPFKLDYVILIREAICCRCHPSNAKYKKKKRILINAKFSFHFNVDCIGRDVPVEREVRSSYRIFDFLNLYF